MKTDEPASSRPSDAGAARAPHEVEVKLECPRETLKKLFELDVFETALPRPRAQKFTSAYFDTDDDALDRAGISLRVRKSGARRLMTVKWSLSRQNIFSRGEVETPIDSDTPDPGRFEPDIAAMINDAAGGNPLVWRFETKIHRRSADFSAGSSRVEIVADDGEIVAAERSAKISECEVELKDGDAAALFRLASALTRAGLWLNPAPKSQRGYLLARGETPAEIRAIDPRLERDTLTEDAFGVIIESCLKQFVDNWPALFEGDHPESIHQMRVALRRLRAALGLFGKAFPLAGFEPFREEAKRIASLLGPARDLDALIAFILEGPLKTFDRDESFDALLSAAQSRRLRAYESARETTRAAETSRLVLDLQAFVASKGWRNGLAAAELPSLATPARAFAAKALERRWKRARRLGADIMGVTPEERHRLRIALKNLRYAVDLLGSLFEEARGVRKFRKALSALQDTLGAHNDAVVARGAILELEPEAGPTASRAAGIVLGWCGLEANRPASQLEDDWRAFQEIRCFWR